MDSSDNSFVCGECGSLFDESAFCESFAATACPSRPCCISGSRPPAPVAGQLAQRLLPCCIRKGHARIRLVGIPSTRPLFVPAARILMHRLCSSPYKWTLVPNERFCVTHFESSFAGRQHHSAAAVFFSEDGPGIEVIFAPVIAQRKGFMRKAWWAALCKSVMTYDRAGQSHRSLEYVPILPYCTSEVSPDPPAAPKPKPPSHSSAPCLI